MYGLGKSHAKISEVMSVVAAGERMTIADLKCESRRKPYIMPRHMAMALCRELTGHSYPVIARHFGDRDHTVIIFAQRKIAALEPCSPPLREKLNHYRQQIAAMVSERVAAMGGCSSQWSPPASMPILRPTVTTVTMGMAA